MERIWTTLRYFTRILKRHPLPFPSSVHVSPWIRSLAFQKPPLFTYQDTVSPTQLPEHFVAFLEHLLPPALPFITARIALYCFLCLLVLASLGLPLEQGAWLSLLVILQQPVLALYCS